MTFPQTPPEDNYKLGSELQPITETVAVAEIPVRG
jgi:hypothetical protein